MKRFFQITILLSIWLAGLTAFGAGKDDALAKQYYAQGVSAFNAGNYFDAQQKFSAGYQISKKPGFLWNMAECARLLKENPTAIELYQKFLRETSLDNAQRPEAEKRLRELQADQVSPVATPTEPPPEPIRPVAAPTEQSTSNSLQVDLPPTSSRPITQKWWFWTGVTAAVAGAVVTSVLLLQPSQETKSSSASTASATSIDWSSK